MVSYTVVAGGGGHSSLAKGIIECLEKNGSEFNIIHPPDPISVEYFKNYESLVLERPRLPLKKFSIWRYVKTYLAVLKKKKFLNDIVISSGASLSFVVSTVAWMLRKKIWNFEVPDRIVNPGETPKALYPISSKTFVSWRQQLKNYPSAVVLNGIILPKPLFKPRKGKYILVTLGTSAEDKNIIEKIALEASKVSKVVVLYRGKEKIDLKTNKVKVISKFLSRKKIEMLLSNSKLVITHPGYTAFDAGINYKKPVLLTINPRYKKGPRPEDARELARILNFKFSKNISINTLKNTIIKKPKQKTAECKLLLT